MKGSRLMFVAGLGVVSYLLYKGANKVTALQLLDYELQALKIQYKNLKVVFKLTMGLVNPTRETFEFKDFIGEISTGGVRIAPITFIPNSSVPVNPNSTTPITISVPVSLLNLPSIISEIIKGNAKDKSFDVTGQLRFKNFDIPVSRSIKLTD